MENSSSFFANRACRYFPCHEGIPEEEFNCLFCYCPLYLLGERCGGDFTYLKNGVKSCVRCRRPHDPAHAEEFRKKIKEAVHSAAVVHPDEK